MRDVASLLIGNGLCGENDHDQYQKAHEAIESETLSELLAVYSILTCVVHNINVSIDDVTKTDVITPSDVAVVLIWYD